jgi:hypothetical protein
MLVYLISGLILALLLYLPGWAVSYRFGASADFLERHYERLIIGALWNGWLAFTLASLGVFSLWLHLCCTTLASALVVVLKNRELKTKNSFARDRSSQFSVLSSQFLVLGSWFSVLLLALLLVARPFEVVLGVRDAGVYANAGFAIARSGGIVQHDAALAELGTAALSPNAALREPAEQALSNFLISQQPKRYIATKLRAAGFLINEGDAPAGRVVPQGLHLLPAWIGLLTSIAAPFEAFGTGETAAGTGETAAGTGETAAAGTGGSRTAPTSYLFGLFAPGLLGWLGVLSVGMLGRRLAGPWVGLLAMLFLCLNGVQIWFSRYSTAETAAQYLIWAGLYFFAAGQQKIENREQKIETQDSQAGVGRSLLSPLFYFLLAGLALGQVAFARLDFFLLAPLLAYLGYCWFTRRWNRGTTALSIGLALMLVQAGLYMLLIARAYVLDTGFARFQDSALLSLLLFPLLTDAIRESYLSSKFSTLNNSLRLAAEIGIVVVAFVTLPWLRARSLRMAAHSPLALFEGWLARKRTLLTNTMFVGILLLASYAYLVRPEIIDPDLLFNTRGGWNDPLTRDPTLVQSDVNSGKMTREEAQLMAGVVLSADPYWRAQLDPAATAAQRARLLAERGPWQGPISNQTTNWLRLQGYVGAPIRLTVKLWYNEYEDMNWWQRLTVDPATLTSEPAPENDKYRIPLANFVRVGWYLSPLGIVLGVFGYALWWRRGLNAGSWLFLAIALVGTVYYVRQTFGTSDQTYIYILRRFLPITYPALCLGMAYALVRPTTDDRRPTTAKASLLSVVGRRSSVVFIGAQLAFLLLTNRPIFAHTEYAGALGQLSTVAGQFEPGRDILLLRGGGPSYNQYRDVPDMVATPLHFAYGLDAFTVKSTEPGRYAEQLAAQVRNWQAEGRTVYTLLSASGASFALPGFALVPSGSFSLDLNEFEALTDQKPRNVSRLTLPFAIYRLEAAATPTLAAGSGTITPNDFVAQVDGFHRPETDANGVTYAWTNGEGLLRIFWQNTSRPLIVRLKAAAGERPLQLGQGELCVAGHPEKQPWAAQEISFTPLGCFALSETMAEYRIEIDPAILPPAPSGSLLLRLESDAWVPAAEDPRQRDQRSVGIQFGGMIIEQ